MQYTNKIPETAILCSMDNVDTHVSEKFGFEIAEQLPLIGSQVTHEFIRYFVASGVALSVDVGTLWFLTSMLHVQYLLSGIIAFILGILVIYIFSVAWVFKTRSIQNYSHEFALFAIIGIVGLGLNEGILWALTGLLGFHYLFSKIVSVFFVFSWNFVARKSILFSK